MIQNSEYTVTAENRLSLCDEISEAVVQFCAQYLEDNREIQRYRLTVEECLFNWLTEESVGQKLIFKRGRKRFAKPYMELIFSGEPMNPYFNDETLGTYGESTLRAMGLIPAYSYTDKQNILRFSINPAQKSSFRNIVIVLAAAVAVGMAGLLLLPAGIPGKVEAGFISPIYDMFFRVLNSVAGPMIFLSVAWGVYGIGDTSTLSMVGKRMLGTFVGNDFLVASSIVIFFPLFGLKFTENGTMVSGLSGFFEMLLSIVPDNIFSPFIEGNTLQVIFLAFAVGIALLFLGKMAESVARALEQINFILEFFMEFISKLVPYFVFLVIVSMLWSGNLAVLKSSWVVLAVLAAAILVLVLLFYAYTAIRQKVSFFMLIRKCLPSFLVALTTASSAATFGLNREIMEKKLGINQSISCFGIPLGMVINNPISVINNVVVLVFFARYYHVECSLTWLLAAIVLCAIIAVATPPIPGGGAIAYTMLFAQLGIPEEALPVVLAMDMLSDFIITAGEMAILLVTLLNTASGIGMVDRAILEKK